MAWWARVGEAHISARSTEVFILFRNLLPTAIVKIIGLC